MSAYASVTALIFTGAGRDGDRFKAQDICPAAERLLIRQSDKYPVLPGPAIYPAAVLDGRSRYVRALNLAYRLFFRLPDE